MQLPPPPPSLYLIRPGDTLFRVARTHRITLAQLLNANPDITNPNLIFPGQPIRIPKPTTFAAKPQSKPIVFTVNSPEISQIIFQVRSP